MAEYDNDEERDDRLRRRCLIRKLIEERLSFIITSCFVLNQSLWTPLITGIMEAINNLLHPLIRLVKELFLFLG